MSLKADRHEFLTDMSYFMNVAATRGLIVTHQTSPAGSGAAMDTASAVVTIPSGGVSGTSPAGLLLNDVVNYDQTRQHINWHKDEVQIGGKVLLLRRGWVVTNAVSGTPVPGDKAYYTNLGALTPTAVTNGTQVGRFLSAVDADGYAKVDINIV